MSRGQRYGVWCHCGQSGSANAGRRRQQRADSQGANPEAKHAPFRAVRPQHGEGSAMALSKVIAAMTCTARHSMLLKCCRRAACLRRGGSLECCPRQHGHGGGAHLPAGQRSAAARQAADRVFPPSVLLSPAPGKAPARGGDPGAPGRLSGSAARGSP